MNALATTLASLEELAQVERLAEQAVKAAHAAKAATVLELRQAGFTQRETADLVGISFQRVSQIERAGWGDLPAMSAADRLSVAREAFQCAKTAQKLREERYAMGYKTETAAFYGAPDAPQADEVEDRVRWDGFYQAAGAEL